MSPEPDEAPKGPEFGPRGYLPERASRRARKIVLRAPLGVQWIIASVVAGVAVLVAGVLFLGNRGDAPQAPFVEVAPLTQVEDATAVEVAGERVLVITAAGRARAFADATDVSFCATARQLEAPDGRVWSLTGRGYESVPSLQEHPVVVVDGVLYVDPSRTLEGPPPSDEVREPAC